ncbi:MAG: hypothetical protein K2K56_00125 [Lachnospiraceae bacterium]|nr:hypothetical protein [Lachnospiraceae bacterium]
MNKKKVLLGLFVICVFICLLGILSIKNYIDKVPKLTVKELGSVEVGQTLELLDMVNVECKGDYQLALAIDSEIADAKVSEDKQSLFVGSSPGTIRVTITGYGGGAELISEETVIRVGRKTDLLSEAGSIINTTSFSLSIYDTYKLQDDESSENEKYFERENPATVLFVYDSVAGNASLKANVEFYKSMLAESYEISDSGIKALESPITNHDKCYYLTWEYAKDNHNCTAVSYIIYEEDTILILTETSYNVDEKSMKEELLEMAQTVNYTGDYHLPKESEYPFSIENEFIRVTVNEGYNSPQAAEVRTESQNSFITDSEMIVVRYAAADDYDKGMLSKFMVEYLNDQDTAIGEQAEHAYQKLQIGDVFKDLSYEEVKLGEVWIDLSDESLSGLTAYKIHEYSKEADYNTDKYYVEIHNHKFCIGISYPFGDEDTMAELYQLFYDVDF